MSPDELCAALFAGGHALRALGHGVVAGEGRTKLGQRTGLMGITGGAPVGIDAALSMAGTVLAHLETHPGDPLVVLVDTQSQAMARRDELLGLNEALAHLVKCLRLASLHGCRTVGILYGTAAAGAFIATALATDDLVALPGAAPSVMDLASIARVTKLPRERLDAMARTTPIFAPGIGPISAMGAVTETWQAPSDDRLDALLATPAQADQRDRRGAANGGRTRAAAVVRAVMDASRA
jgi:malonate decarboxylase gamma subunit